MPEAVSLLAPAKANLFLRVLAREATGFHTLETLFCTLTLADEVRVVRGGNGGVELTVEGSVDTGPPERNLCVLAASAFLASAGLSEGLRIVLTKRIPAGGGLGGGSSDGATVLRALERLFPGALTHDRVLQIGAGLGSDLPFFLSGASCALAWGRGDRLLRLPALPSRPVLIAHPGTPMATPQAYAALAGKRGPSTRASAAVLDPAALRSWEGVASVAGNDFEEIVTAEIPLLARVRRRMVEGGARIALLAGSGSSYLGVFDDADERDAAGAALVRDGVAIWRAETSAGEPHRVDRPQGQE